MLHMYVLQPDLRQQPCIDFTQHFTRNSELIAMAAYTSKYTVTVAVIQKLIYRITGIIEHLNLMNW